jgi:hypothetical protein
LFPECLLDFLDEETIENPSWEMCKAANRRAERHAAEFRSASEAWEKADAVLLQQLPNRFVASEPLCGGDPRPCPAASETLERRSRDARNYALLLERNWFKWRSSRCL